MTAAARSWTPINGADITARQRASRWGGLFKKKSRLPVAASAYWSMATMIAPGLLIAPTFSWRRRLSGALLLP